MKLQKLEHEREPFSKVFISSLKFAEFIENGTTAALDKLSRKDIEKISRSVEHHHNHPYILNHSIFDWRQKKQKKKIAVRYHCSKGLSIAKGLQPTDLLTGEAFFNNGIKFANEITAADASLFTDVDNWIHVSLPNFTIDDLLKSLDTDKRTTRVQLKAAGGGTSMIKDNVLRVSVKRPVSFCREYIRRKLGVTADTEIYLYSTGTFKVHDDELLGSLIAGGKDILLYYSLSEVW